MNPQVINYLSMVIPILLALTVHEYSHGYIAYRLGDNTAKSMGRLTLNPISHIDPIGLIMLFVIGMGWAKPVPINIYAFKNPKRDLALSAAAGPASNFIMAAIAGLSFRLFPGLIPMNNDPTLILFLKLNLLYFMLINVGLGIFNLIPIPPLDGSKILRGFMKDKHVYIIDYMERYGGIILLAVVFLGRITGFSIFGRLIGPLINAVVHFFSGINI